MLRKYFRDAGILGLTEIVLRLKGLVLVPILTKHFGAVNYGIWAQVTIIVGMLSPLMASGLDSAAMRFLPGKTKQEIGRGIATVLAYNAALSAVVAVLLWILARPIASAFFAGEQNSRFVAICGGVIFIGLAMNASRNFYRIIGNAKIFSIINIAQSAYGALIAVGVAVFKGTIFDVIVVGLLMDTVLLSLLIAHIVSRYGIRELDVPMLIQFLHFGLPLVPAGYAMWVLNASDRLFITGFGTLQDLGVYSVAYSLGYMLINFFFNPIWLMFPSQASELWNKGDLEGLSRLFCYSTKAALGLLVPAMIGFSVLAEPIFRMLTTEEFVRGASLVPVITLGYVCHMVGSYFGTCLGLVGKQAWITVNLFIAAAVNLLLNWALIPTWGIAGAAAATALSFALQMGLGIWMGTREVQLRFDWIFFGKVCLASGGMALALLPLRALPETAGRWSVLLIMGAGVVVFGLLMVLLRALEPAETRALLRATKLQWLEGSGFVRVILGI